MLVDRITEHDAGRRLHLVHAAHHLAHEVADETRRARVRIASGATDAVLEKAPGFEAYRKIYSDVITPRRVAELLILREDMPRSLHSCMNFIHETLEVLCDSSTKEIERAAYYHEFHFWLAVAHFGLGETKRRGVDGKSMIKPVVRNGFSRGAIHRLVEYNTDIPG